MEVYTKARMKVRMIIERANKFDAKEILELQKLAYKSEAELYNDHTIAPMTQTLEDMRNEFERQIFLNAIEEKKIIGSVRGFSKEQTCYIGRLMVHPDFQNHGIGTNLMNEIESLFKDCRRFELFTGNKSKKNLILYQKLGYKTFKTEKITDQVTLVYLEKKII